MVQIYKNLYYDDAERCYVFISEDDKRLVVSQESYLLIYLLENIIDLNAKINKQEVFNLNANA